MGARQGWVRFRCGCGRQVAAPADSDAGTARRCTRCRDRAVALHGKAAA
jgi:hypothetical protein